MDRNLICITGYFEQNVTVVIYVDVRLTPMESNEQWGTEIENESKRPSGMVNIDQNSPTEKVVNLKGGPAFLKLFRLDPADPFSFRPKFL